MTLLRTGTCGVAWQTLRLTENQFQTACNCHVMGNLQRGGRSHFGGEGIPRRNYCIFMGIGNTTKRDVLLIIFTWYNYDGKSPGIMVLASAQTLTYNHTVGAEKMHNPVTKTSLIHYHSNPRYLFYIIVDCNFLPLGVRCFQGHRNAFTYIQSYHE